MRNTLVEHPSDVNLAFGLVFEVTIFILLLCRGGLALQVRSVTVEIPEPIKPYLFSFGSWSALCRCSRRAQCFSFLTTFLDHLVNIIPNPGPQWFVDYKFIQRRDLLLTVGTDKVVFKEMGLDTLLTVRLLTTRSLDGVAEQSIVDGANQ